MQNARPNTQHDMPHSDVYSVIINRLTMKKEKLTYEEAMQRLETIVESLEQNKLDLEDLGKSLAEAKNLAQICKEKLALAENDIKKILEEDEQE